MAKLPRTAEARKLEYVALDALQPAPRNPKRHDIDKLKDSFRRFGFVFPGTRDDRTGRTVAGHGRAEALGEMHDAGEPAPRGIVVDDTGRWLVPVIVGWSSANDREAEALLVIDNHHPALAGWDDPGLGELLADLNANDPALLLLTGFTDHDITALLAAGDAGTGGKTSHTDPDAIPDKTTATRTKPGDLWLLGPHRLLCGDSTNPTTVERLVNGQPLALIHSDPPYGMGKEADGIANDNLYGAKLDSFQMDWWRAWSRVLADNGSAYIWGNAPDLWRLWWAGGLAEQPDLLVRNEIVWDKQSVMSMRTAGQHSYPVATERCLFLMRGQQFLGNQNTEDYWEGYEPLRSWLEAERDKAGWSNKDANQITGTQMAGHWFTRSQFIPISAKHYAMLQQAAAGRAFTASYDELFGEMFPELRAGGNDYRRSLSAALRETRSYFDNTHDAMTDVWQFGRVTGEDRYGHATPKPVAMVERAFLSSTRPGEVIGVPFGGTGPEFIAGFRLDRVIVAMELEPAYVDLICRRYQEHTGEKPILEATGEAHDFTGGRA